VGLESGIQRRMVNEIRRRGGFAIGQVSPPAPKGTPDILACYLGVSLAIEVKRPEGKLTKLQHHNLKKAQDAGALACVLEDQKQLRALLFLLENASKNQNGPNTISD